jgi:hypothetical protein
MIEEPITRPRAGSTKLDQGAVAIQVVTGERRSGERVGRLENRRKTPRENAAAGNELSGQSEALRGVEEKLSALV